MKEFIDKNGVNLIIEYNKNNIFIKTDEKNIIKNYILRLEFHYSVFVELKEYLEIISKKIWADFEQKESNSLRTDYNEYYDRKYDSNGYLALSNSNKLTIEKPSKEAPYIYKFNKKRMESFIYDIENYYIKKSLRLNLRLFCCIFSY